MLNGSYASLDTDAINTNCAFCLRSNFATNILKETDAFFIVADHAPLVEGHILILPKRHFACYGVVPAELDAELLALKREVQDFFARYYAPIVFWEHGIFRQTVFHAHLHCFPFGATEYNVTKSPHSLVVQSQDDVRAWYAMHGHYFYMEDRSNFLLFAPETDRYLKVIKHVLWPGVSSHSQYSGWRSPQQRYEQGAPLIRATMDKWHEFQRLEQTMQMKPVRDEFVVAGDLTFHYLQWGEQGPPIIFVHGITANAFCFQAYADELARDHRVFAYDQRGRGDSDKPESGYSMPNHATDLAALIDAWELNRPVIAGHSSGAFIALYFAVHYPEKLSKLVLIDAGASAAWKTIDEQPAWLTVSISRLGTPVASFEEYKQRLKAAPFLGPYWNPYIDLYFEHDVYRRSDGSVVSKAYREGIIKDGKYNFYVFKPEELWKEVTVPTLLMRAGQGLFTDNDQLLPEEAALAIQRGIKNCSFVNFPSLSHYTIIFGIDDGPVRAIRDFVDKEN